MWLMSIKLSVSGYGLDVFLLEVVGVVFVDERGLGGYSIYNNLF